jgi:hypothetical protein
VAVHKEYLFHRLQIPAEFQCIICLDKYFSWIARSCHNASHVYKVERIINHPVIFGIIGLKLTIRGMLGMLVCPLRMLRGWSGEPAESRDDSCLSKSGKITNFMGRIRKRKLIHDTAVSTGSSSLTSLGKLLLFNFLEDRGGSEAGGVECLV